jgi:hypothetical protein
MDSWVPDVIQWSGCKDTQTSADTSAAGQATGAMSYAFISAMSAFPPSIILSRTAFLTVLVSGSSEISATVLHAATQYDPRRAFWEMCDEFLFFRCRI